MWNLWRRCVLIWSEVQRKRISKWKDQLGCLPRLWESLQEKISHGRGSKSWARFQMMMHKELTDSYSPEIIKQITSIAVESGVEVVVFLESKVERECVVGRRKRKKKLQFFTIYAFIFIYVILGKVAKSLVFQCRCWYGKVVRIHCTNVFKGCLWYSPLWCTG